MPQVASWWDKVKRSARAFIGGMTGLVFVGGTALSVMPLTMSPRWQDGFRYMAAVLQVFGLLLVGLGLEDTRRRFGLPGLRTTAIRWAQSVLGPFKKPQHLRLEAAIGSSFVVGPATLVAHGTTAPKSVDERLTAVETEVQRLRQEDSALRDALSAAMKSVGKELAAEAQTRGTEDVALRTLMADALAGSLHFEWIGFVWLLLATLVASFAEELGALLS